jgi:hypothetical protein
VGAGCARPVKIEVFAEAAGRTVATLQGALKLPPDVSIQSVDYDAAAYDLTYAPNFATFAFALKPDASRENDIPRWSQRLATLHVCTIATSYITGVSD